MEHKKLIVGVLVLLLAARVAGVSAAPRDANGAPSRDVQELAQEVPGWQQVNSNGFGVQQAGEVSAVGAFDGQLYAGTHNAMDGARIFRSPDGVTWTPVTQPGFGISHDIAPPAILDLTVFNGRLYASTGRGDGPAQIWRTLNGVAWVPMVITGFSDPDTVDVTALVEYNGLLYAGATNLINGAQIWRSYTGDNNTWAQVAPAAPGTAPASVTGLAVFDGALYAAIESEAPAQIWRSYGGDWTTVVSDGFGNNETTSTGGTAEFAGYLYVGAGNARDGAQLWRTHDGVNWTQAISPGFGDSNNQKVEMVFVFQNHLYASAKNARTGIELWRSTDGSLWEQANLNGFGDSNNSGTNWSNATAEFLGHLYVGTSNVVEGGELWQMQGHEADLALSKADALDPVEVGTPLTYTLTVSNSGPSAATEVTVTDELPAGIVYGSVSGSGWNCGHQGGVVTCTLPTLAVGAAPDILITVIAPERAGTVTNTALIAAATFDPHLANNTDSESTRIQEAGTWQTDLSINRGRIGSGHVVAGEGITYTIAITNAGPTAPITATIVDTWTPIAAVTAVDAPGCETALASGVITCTRTGLGLGSVLLPDPYLVFTTSQTFSGTLVNVAHVATTGGVIDTDPTNNVSGPIAATVIRSQEYILYLPLVLK